MGIDSSDLSKVVDDERIIKFYETIIEKSNGQFSKWEQVKKFKLLPQEFTIDGGELTPTLKLKRKNIMNKYQDLVEGIFA